MSVDFEIGDEQLFFPPRRRLDQDIDRGAADDIARGCGDRRRVRSIEDQIAGQPRREPDRASPDRQCGRDRSGEAGKVRTGGAGDQGQGEAHARSSYALPPAGDKRFARDAGLMPAVVIAGPTASGKSALASALASAMGGTVINADSLQCYRDLQILTARPGIADAARAPHRLYGFLDAAERGSVASWRALALAEIAAAISAGRLPIMVGGTGLYIRALTDGLAAFPEIPEEVRREAAALHRMLGGAAFRRPPGRVRCRRRRAAARRRPAAPDPRL